MKRVFYILTAALVTLGACTKEIDWNAIPVEESADAVYPEGAYIDMQFSVPMPAATRAGEMADNPVIDSMFVAVFDASGTLKQYELAEIVPVTQNGRANAQYFKVRLLLKSSECRLHFLANGPQKKKVTGGMESVLLQQWTTDYPNGAYWQRIVLPEGITAYSFSETKPDGTAWADGDYIHFWYLVKTDENEEEYYEPSKEGVANVQHKSYRISVTSSGRPYYTAGSQTVNVGDFVNAKGEKILDGTGYFQSTSVTEAVESVPLVRNFARLKVKAGSGNFTPSQYYLMNIADKGTIAPYSTAVGGFAPQYSVSNYNNTSREWVSGDPMIYDLTEVNENHDDLMTSLTGSRYPADIPSSGKLIHTVAEVKANTNAIPSDWTVYNAGATDATLANTPSAFLFERGVPNKNQDPTYLLIGGSLTGYTGTRWFKVELTDALGRYFRVFRDVTYFLEIGQIDGSDGYATAAEAALGTPVSDVSNSLATENLEQVSDGKGTSMWVSYIDYVGNNPDGEVKAILYKVFDSTTGDALTPLINGESRYTLEVTDSTAIEGTLVTEDSAYSGVGPDGKSDWRYAEVKLVKPSLSGIVHGELLVSGITSTGESSGSGKTLSRRVKYHVMSTQRLTLSATALATEASGQETKLTITLPSGLGYSMFPLVLQIEAEKANLNPVASKNKVNGVLVDLPVTTGTSYFSDKNTFSFLFTINYSDYYDRSNTTNPYNTKYELYFSTTKDYTGNGATGSNETWFSVTDQGGYFFYKPEDESKLYDTSVNYAVTPVTVTNGNAYFTVTPANQTVTAETTTATFTVKTNSTNEWTVSNVTTGVTVSPTSGKGNGTFTMTFSANTNTSSRDFTATVTPTTGTAQEVKVTQQKVLEKVTKTGTATFSYSNFSSGTNVSATVNDIKVTFSTISAVSNNYEDIEFTNVGTITMKVEDASSLEDFVLTGVTVTYYNNRNYYPTSVSSTPSGFTRNGRTGSWAGSSDNLVVSMTKNSGEFDITGISVSYSYSAWE